MAGFNRFDSLVEALAEKKHNFGADTLKVMLTNTQPDPTDAIKSDIAELPPGNGYTAGGNTAAIDESALAGSTYKLVLTSPAAWSAEGGSIGPFQFAVLYNASAPNGELIGWWDHETAVTLNDGDSFIVAFSTETGVLTLS